MPAGQLSPAGDWVQLTTTHHPHHPEVQECGAKATDCVCIIQLMYGLNTKGPAAETDQRYLPPHKALCGNKEINVNWMVNKFNLDLSLVARLKEGFTTSEAEHFPGKTITYALIQKVEKDCGKEKSTPGAR